MPFVINHKISLYYETKGQGEAIIFLHGFTGSSNDWRNQTNRVSDRFQTVAMDFRGHGRSDAPEGEEDYSIYLNCDDVRTLMAELGINRCCLVGHSMGGFTALQFAVENPEMLWGLVLVDTSSGQWDTPPEYAKLRQKLDELARQEGLEAAFNYDAENNAARIDRYKIQPEQKEIARVKTLQTAVDAYIYVPRSFGKWQAVTDRLGDINVPTLVFRGAHDVGFVNPSQVLAEKIPGAELVVVPDAYHNPHEEAPEMFNKAFEAFLEKVSKQ